MTRRNRNEIVEQEKHQTEEITQLKKESDNNTNAQDEMIASIKNEENQPEDNSHIELDSPTEESPLVILEAKLAEMNDKYLRLSAEFDNFRKRTMREKAELIRSAGEDILTDILPIIDNFERALIAIQDARDPEAIKEGVKLIYSKFKDFLSQRGIKEIDTLSKPFDSDLHDAITKVPVTSREQQGIVIDVVEKGYYLNDKIIRHSKVVVGEYNVPGTSGEASQIE